LDKSAKVSLQLQGQSFNMWGGLPTQTMT